VDEVARKLAGEDIENIEIVDVRSHGYYDRGATRIHPSIRLDPNNLKSRSPGSRRRRRFIFTVRE